LATLRDKPSKFFSIEIRTSCSYISKLIFSFFIFISHRIIISSRCFFISRFSSSINYILEASSIYVCPRSLSDSFFKLISSFTSAIKWTDRVLFLINIASIINSAFSCWLTFYSIQRWLATSCLDRSDSNCIATFRPVPIVILRSLKIWSFSSHLTYFSWSFFISIALSLINVSTESK